MLSLSGSFNTLPSKKSSPDREYKTQFEWESKLQLVANFYDNFQRRPRHGSSDCHEALIARWLNTQIVAINSGNIKPERMELLKDRLPWLKAKSVRSFDDWISDLRNFVGENSRVPKNTVDEERALAQWLHGERVKYKKGLLSPERRRKLESIPGSLSRQSFSDTFEMCCKAEAWCEYYRHLPRLNFSSSHELSPSEIEEAKLASWMRNHAREGIRSNETAESVFRREFILELFRIYPSWSSFKVLLDQGVHFEEPMQDQSLEGITFNNLVDADQYAIDPAWRRTAELVLLEFEMSDWSGRSASSARRHRML